MAYIPIAPKSTAGGVKRSYVPISEREKESKPRLGEAFQDVSVFGKTSLSTPAIAEGPSPYQQIGGIGKAVGQGIARGYAATGSKLAKVTNLASTDIIDPQTYFGTSVFGQSLAETVFGTTKPFNATSEDIDFLGAFGVDTETASKTGGGLTLLMSALDLTGSGGVARGISGAIKAVRAAQTAEEAVRVGKALGLAEDVALEYAMPFVKANTAKEAKAVLEAASKLQNTTYLKTSNYTPIVSKEAEVPIKPLAERLVDDVAQPQSTDVVDDVIAESDVPLRDVRPRTLEAPDGLPPIPREADDSVFKNMGQDYDRAEYEVLTELQLSQPGSRIFIERSGQGGTKEVIASPSTFPKYVPEDLRSKELFERVIKKLSEGVEVTGRRERALVDVIEEQILKRMQPEMADEVATTKFIRELEARASQESDILLQSLQKDIVRGLKNKRFTLKQYIRGTESAAERASRKTKRIEQIAAKRQVAVEKRQTQRAIAQTRKSILEKLRISTEATDDIRKDITDFVKETLDPDDRGKALTLVRDAKTQKDLTKAFARVNRWAEDAAKKSIRNDILKAQKSIMDSPSVSIDYKNRIKQLMGDFELRGHNETTIERLQKTQEWLDSEIAKGNDVEIPRRTLRALEILNRTPFDEITMSQLQGLQAEMELLEQLGRTKFRTIQNVWDIQKEKILSEITSQGAPPLNNIEMIRPEIGERLTMTQKMKNFVWGATNQFARIDKAISPMDSIFDLLDGGLGTYNGANFKYFKARVDAGYGKYISRRDALQSPVIELATKNKLDDRSFERMGIVAARDQDGGMAKLVASGFTEEEVNAVKLTAPEQEVLDKMRETFDSQFPEIQDTMRRVYNQSVEKVKNYFSFMTDFKAMDESEVFQRFGSQAPEQYGAPRKNVEAGFTMSRVGGAQKIKVNALEIFMNHTDNTSYLLELGDVSKSLGEVAASPKYGELVGDVGQLMVREWLDVIARKGGAAGASEIAILNTLRKNVGAGILGLKLSTVAIQPTALIDGAGFIGAGYTSRGVTSFATSAEWRKYVSAMPEIKDRMGGEFALRELTDDNWLQNAQRIGFIPMQALDQMTAGAIAAGAYQRKMAELGKAVDLTAPYDPEALAYAQLAVRRTQSSGAFKDVPLAVSRGALTGNRSLDRAILQFQNFLLTRWSRIRHDAIRAGINTGDPKKAIPVFTALIMSAVVASGIRLGVNRLTDLLTGSEDEDSAAEDLQRSFLFEMTGNVPFLGTAVSMAVYDGEMFPILDAPKGVISGLNRVITSESESAKLRGFAEFAGSTGAILGIPGSAQVEQLVSRSLKENPSSNIGGKSKTPSGLPQLPSFKKMLPTPPGLPSLP